MSERTIALADLDQDQAEERLNREPEVVSGIQDAVINFTDVNDYTTFKAEYAWVDGDLIVHFFLTKEMVQANKTEEGGPLVKQYWLHTFPLGLDKASKEYFQSDSPRLQAKYTDELASWYFRAQNYGDRLDPDLFVESFLEHLDQVLETPQTPASPS